MEMKTVPVLVIDDLGQEKKSEWTNQILYQVINYRYEHMSPIIITTNFTQDELANYLGEAKASRLYEVSYAVPMKGTNYRMEK
jgi:DNA replication protein DnaC